MEERRKEVKCFIITALTEDGENVYLTKTEDSILCRKDVLESEYYWGDKMETPQAYWRFIEYNFASLEEVFADILHNGCIKFPDKISFIGFDGKIREGSVKVNLDTAAIGIYSKKFEEMYKIRSI